MKKLLLALSVGMLALIMTALTVGAQDDPYRAIIHEVGYS